MTTLKDGVRLALAGNSRSLELLDGPLWSSCGHAANSKVAELQGFTRDVLLPHSPCRCFICQEIPESLNVSEPDQSDKTDTKAEFETDAQTAFRWLSDAHRWGQ